MKTRLIDISKSDANAICGGGDVNDREFKFCTIGSLAGGVFGPASALGFAAICFALSATD